MSRKTSKKMKKKPQPTSSEKQTPKPVGRSFYNLPEQPKEMQDVTYIYSCCCVIKSWRWPSRQCTTTLSRHPTLVETHPKYASDSWGPKFDIKRFFHIGNITMVVTGDCSPAFAYNSMRTFWNTPSNIRGLQYKPHWIVEHCNIREPYAPAQSMRFCNAVAFKGRFYVISLQGSVAVIEEEEVDSDCFRITRVGGNRAVPSEACKHFREYMFESDGEVLVVLLVSRESIEVVDDVEVLRLDTEKLLWVKLGKIGNKALFVGDKHCMWAEACEVGFKRDCVYFIHKWVDDWMVFNMETGNILPAFD